MSAKKSFSILSLIILITSANTLLAEGIIYVDANAAGGNSGYSWGDAHNYLQDALEHARISGCNDIRVAEGNYKPDVNSAHPNGTGDRQATFQIINGVAVYGGFPVGGGQWEDRKPSIYKTILSGDLLGNDREVNEPCDLLTDPCRADNSYHIVTGSGINKTAILDGFIITGGNANGTDTNNSGGGIYSNNGSPAITNCRLIENSAALYGGGIYSFSGSPTIINCELTGNSAQNGGGMYNTGAPNIINCVFFANAAKYGGGLFHSCHEITTTVTNCTFVGNSADNGGGIGYEDNGSARVTNCILWGNWVGQISGSASVAYSDIAGGCAGVGNISKDPMFEPDGYHLTPCSPCIDAGDPDYVAEPNEKDIDGEDRIFNGTVDMGADEYNSEDYISAFAHCPEPSCGGVGALDVNKPLEWNINLTWYPGRFAADVNGHDVYFGTDFYAVNEANSSWPIATGPDDPNVHKGRQSEPNYLARNLAPYTTYFWQIDEVNQAGPDPCIWPGPVWSFTTGLFIDNFNNYVSSDDLNTVWKKNYLTGSGTCPGTGYVGGGGTPILDAGAMILDYNNTGKAKDRYSELRFEYPAAGADWTTGNSKILSISYKGLADNNADPCLDRMFTLIRDAAGHQGPVVYNPDPNAQQKTTWQEWDVNLSDLNTPDVNLKSVRYLWIGLGLRCNKRGTGIGIPGGGSGRVWFDNIRLDKHVVVPNIVGLCSMTDANNAITDANLTVGPITYQYSNTVAAGCIISQDPTYPNCVTAGSVVSYMVSKGIQPPAWIAYGPKDWDLNITPVWAPVAGATGYKLERSASGAGGPWTQVYDGNNTGTVRFRRDAVTAGTYRYKVRAYNAVGTGTDYCTLNRDCVSAWETCFPTADANYAKWKTAGRPRPWCYKRQCHGDASGTSEGGPKTNYWAVGNPDLNILKSAWILYEPPDGNGIDSINDPNVTGGDMSRSYEGTPGKTPIWRVGNPDLNILKAYWQIKESPLGPGVPTDCGGNL